MAIVPNNSDRFEEFPLKDGTIAFIEVKTNDIYFTAKSIAQGLKYEGKRPEKQVYNIVNDHKDEINGLTTVTKLVTEDGRLREVILYHEQAFYKICMWSRQPKAIHFRDKVAQMLQEVRQKGFIIPQFKNPIDRQLFLIDQMREVLLREKEITEQLEKHEEDIHYLKTEFQEHMPLSDRQIKIIRTKSNDLFKSRKISAWKILQRHCDFSKLERCPRYKWNCIMRILTDLENEPIEQIQERYSFKLYPCGKTKLVDEKAN